MVSNLCTKKNISSTNVLKTLLLLIEDSYTMNELVKILNTEENRWIFNNSTVSKYINTCRYCGIEIYKVCNKYILSSLPFGLNLDQNNLDLFEYMRSFSGNFLTNNSNQIFNKFIEKINKFSNKQLSVTEKETKKISFTLFENAIKNKRKVKIYFRPNTVISCIPVSISKSNDEFFFNVIYKDKEKSIKTSKITCVELLDEKYFSYIKEKAVIYRLFNGLEKRYTLKDNEKLVNSKFGEITISCIDTDKDELFKRLIRYDCCCEILYPVSYREEFKEIIKNTLNNYEV